MSGSSGVIWDKASSDTDELRMKAEGESERSRLDGLDRPQGQFVEGTVVQPGTDLELGLESTSADDSE
jgi:hypothetical protein